MADGLISEHELMLLVQQERENPRKKKSKSKKRDKSPSYVESEVIYQDDLVLGSQDIHESKPASDFLVQAMDRADRHDDSGQSPRAHDIRSPIHSPPLNMHVGQGQGSSQTIRQAPHQATTLVAHPQVIHQAGATHMQTAAAHIVSHHPQAGEAGQGPPYIASVMIDGVSVQLAPEVQAQIQGQWSYM